MCTSSTLGRTSQPGGTGRLTLSAICEGGAIFRLRLRALTGPSPAFQTPLALRAKDPMGGGA
jgi:hypothetical protein